MAAGGNERVPRRVAVPTAIGGMLVLAMIAAMVVLLVLVLGSLRTTTHELARANGHIAQTEQRLARLRRELEPTAERAPDFFRTGRRDLRVLRAEAEQVTEQQIPPIRDAATALASGILPVLPEARDALAAARSLLGDVRAADLIDVAVGALRTVPDLRALLRQLQDRFADSLRVQCILLAHIVSLDRKTGGPVPPATQTDEPPPECREPPAP